MIDLNKVREALMLVVGSAVESKYELGFVVPAVVIESARAALRFKESTVRFADGKYGCSECGNYADPITGEVIHRVNCRIFERPTATKNSEPAETLCHCDAPYREGYECMHGFLKPGIKCRRLGE